MKKRILALAIAIFMLLGMTTVFAAAASLEDFTDANNVDPAYSSAMNALVSLGIVKGTGGNAISPQGSVTREQLAKMIFVAKFGSEDAAKYYLSDTKVFEDVESDRWSAGFINYCASQGIISGDSGLGSNFRPEEPVTGYEAAKMLLVACGYGQNREFTGNVWALNVATAAQSAGIFEGSQAANYQAAATREEAALYIYNSLSVESVKYDKVTAKYEPTGKTLFDSFGVTRVEGIVTATPTRALDGVCTDSGVKIDDKVYDIDSDCNEYLGKRVELVYRSKDMDVLGIYDISETVETAAALPDAAAVTAALGNLKLDGTQSELRYTGAASDRTAHTGGVTARAGAVQRFIDNDEDGKVDWIIAVAPAGAKVTAVSDESVTLSGLGAVKRERLHGAAALQAGDFVSVVRNDDDSFDVAPLTTLKATVTAYASGAVTLDDGSTRGLSAGAGTLTGTGLLTSLGSHMLSATYNFAVDADGLIYCAEYLSGGVITAPPALDLDFEEMVQHGVLPASSEDEINYDNSGSYDVEPGYELVIRVVLMEGQTAAVTIAGKELAIDDSNPDYIIYSLTLGEADIGEDAPIALTYTVTVSQSGYSPAVLTKTVTFGALRPKR